MALPQEPLMTKSLYLNIAKLTRLNILMRKRMTLRLTALTTSSTPSKPKAIVIKLVKVVTLLNRDLGLLLLTARAAIR
jgi:hypothetical protein